MYIVVTCEVLIVKDFTVSEVQSFWTSEEEATLNCGTKPSRLPSSSHRLEEEGEGVEVKL